MFDGWTKPKFYSKCKSAVRHMKTRLEPIKKKRVAVEKFLKKDIADLLRGNLDYNAYLRADMLLVEQNMTGCYDLVEQFCACISNNLPDMQKERECPEECREAAASLAYAAARFADLPELRELRSMFAERYGNSFESFANKKFVEKLNPNPPTKDMKLQLLQNIAQEFSIDWDSKALEQKLFSEQDSGNNCNKNKDGDAQGVTNKLRDKSHDSDVENKRPLYAKEPFTSDVKEKKPSEEAEAKAKPKARSVRRRRPLSYENVKHIAASGDNNNNNNNNNKSEIKDEEERVLDGLLLHYSMKKSSLCEDRGNYAKSSLRESERDNEAANYARKARARASSVELGGHVHPRLPDYDELAARVAALREI